MAITRAQSTYLTFSRVNALSFASLADAVVILFALFIINHTSRQNRFYFNDDENSFRCFCRVVWFGAG
jgi:hypothetical protein